MARHVVSMPLGGAFAALLCAGPAAVAQLPTSGHVEGTITERAGTHSVKGRDAAVDLFEPRVR